MWHEYADRMTHSCLEGCAATVVVCTAEACAKLVLPPSGLPLLPGASAADPTTSNSAPARREGGL